MTTATARLDLRLEARDKDRITKAAAASCCSAMWSIWRCPCGRRYLNAEVLDNEFG